MRIIIKPRHILVALAILVGGLLLVKSCDIASHNHFVNQKGELVGIQDGMHYEEQPGYFTDDKALIAKHLCNGDFNIINVK